MAMIPRRGLAMNLAAGIWLAAILTVMAVITNYSNIPGAAGVTPAEWPAQSKLLVESGLPTLVMFAHPHCPCTEASLGELELLMATNQGRVNAQVVFIQPPGTTEEWVKSDLWRKAVAIPGVKVSSDPGGIETQRFHAETSGHTVLYDTTGRRLFTGGITIARGHMGDNPGLDTLAAMLAHEQTSQAQTPIFGCTLSALTCGQDATSCKL
jgi:hypothetical protein